MAARRKVAVDRESLNDFLLGAFLGVPAEVESTNGWASGINSPRRGRPPDPRLLKLDEELIAIVKEHKPITVRGVFYQAVVKALVSKDEASADKVQRRLLALRRAERIDYSAIVDESRDVHGNTGYRGLSHFANNVGWLYDRNPWAESDCRVQIWIEKRGLAGVLEPIVDKWRVRLFPCGGQPSETYLYEAGQEIQRYGVLTHIYVLSDFDPAGLRISRTLDEGTRKVEGLSRFCGDVPIELHKLALTHKQVLKWKLPTRYAKETDPEYDAFVEEYGDISTELDALPPNQLRDMVDKAIAQHMSEKELKAFKALEEEEREIAESYLLKAAKKVERMRRERGDDGAA
jgi:hypothetical protein